MEAEGILQTTSLVLPFTGEDIKTREVGSNALSHIDTLRDRARLPESGSRLPAQCSVRYPRAGIQAATVIHPQDLGESQQFLAPVSSLPLFTLEKHC